MKSIIMYSQPDCPPCEIAKRFLTEYGFTFEVRDIKESQKAKEELVHKYQSYSTPTFVIDGEVVSGFDLNKLKQLLGVED